RNPPTFGTHAPTGSDGALLVAPGRYEGSSGLASSDWRRLVTASTCRICSAAAVLLLVPALLSPAIAADEEKQQRFPQGEWVPLFNGKNLDGWIPKIRYHEAGDNFADTFRVEDGLLKVRYDGYEQFGERFGHLFYNTPFSHYRLRVEYRFVGDQCEGGPGWAIRNSGIMVHGESAPTMSKDEDVPASIEVQLLGGNGEQQRTTSNLCTPYTNVVMNGDLVTRHCTSSTSKTYHGEQWVTAEVEVRGNEVI